VGLLVWIALGLAKMRLPLSMKRSENVRQFVLLALPDVVGGAVTRVNPIVDQTMAATVGLAGAGTLLKQALDTADFPTSILQSALLPILLTHLSDDVARGNALQFRQTVLRSLASVCAMLAALAGVLYWARVPLVRLVFLHGAMDPVAIHHLTSLLPYALLGLPPMGALMVLARAHIALKNTKLMFPLGVLNAGLHVGLNALFVRWVGLGGLALSSACVNVVIALLFWWKLEELLGSQRSFVFEHASGEPPSR
jgi:putative peptidoglycan lipid II flippase